MCARAGERLSQREIARMLDVSPTAVANSVRELKARGLVRIEKTKTINFISFNRDEQRAIELKRVENLKMAYTSGLSDYLHNALPGGTIYLFGSFSRGEDVATSDIDIAVIGRRQKALELGKYGALLNRKINVNFYDSWGRIGAHFRNNILSGILLHGRVELEEKSIS